MRTRGFTILEVLGIMPVVALLVGVGKGILLPPGDKVNQVTCLSHLQELGQAFQMYREDWNDTLPLWANTYNTSPLPAPFNAESGALWTWDVEISPYVLNLSTFTCPYRVQTSPDPRFPIRNYTFPRNVSGMPYGAAPLPDLTVLVYEKGTQPVGLPQDATGEWFQQFTSGTVPPMFYYPNNPERWGRRHGMGNNFLFLDGRVSWEPELLFTTPSRDNPYGYSFGNSPAPGKFQYGYCGDKGSIVGGQPAANEWGANLPH